MPRFPSLYWCPLGTDWSLQHRVRNSPRNGAGREDSWDMVSCRNVEQTQLSQSEHAGGLGAQWWVGMGGGEREAQQEELPFSIPSQRDLACRTMMQDMLKLDIENKTPNT